MASADFATTPVSRLDDIQSEVVQTWRINHGLQRSEGPGASSSADFVALFCSVSDKANKKASGAVHVGVLNLADKAPMPHIRHLVSHAGPVVDVKFSPFYDTFLATASHDNTVKLWQIPEDPMKKLSWPTGTLDAHKPGVCTLAFNHVVDDILVTTGGDKRMKLWDLSVQQLVWSAALVDGTYLSWSYDGNLIAAVTKPCGLSIHDGRNSEVSHSIDQLHPGSKSAKMAWIERGPGQPGRLLTTGTNQDGVSREVSIWDLRNLSSPTKTETVDRRAQRATHLHPHWDPQTQMVYLGSRGDNNLIAYHIDEADSMQAKFLHRDRRKMVSFCFLPKRALDMTRNEIGRVFIQGGSGHVAARSIFVPESKYIEDNDTVPELRTRLMLTDDGQSINGGNAEALKVLRASRSTRLIEEFGKELEENPDDDDEEELVVEPTQKNLPFDSELYPSCPSGFPSLSCDDWLDGLDGYPHLWSMDPNKIRPMRTRNKIQMKQNTFMKSFKSMRSKSMRNKSKTQTDTDDVAKGGCCC